ncbi:hypothetical protein Trydic_g18283 [Trypoxylus dichotomus]
MDMDIFDREAVLQKVMDKDRRKENIIFINVPEETSGDKNCQTAADVVTCKNILSTLDVVLTGPIRPIRLSSSVCDAEGVFLTGTWLADDVDNGEFMDPPFVVYRSDRRFALVGRSIGGSVLSAFTEKLSVAPMNASTLADLLPLIDVAIFKCKMFFLLVYIVNLYIPPNIELDDYEIFIDALGIFLLDKQCILVRDFNAPAFNMPDLDDRRTSSILFLMETLNLRQLNDITNLNGKLLDLVLTNLDVEFAVGHDLAPFVGEDPHHLALDILISLDLPSDRLDFPSNTNLRYNFRKLDVPALCSELGAVDWDTLLDHGNVDCAVQIFYNRLYTVLDHCVPKIKSTNRHYPPWFTANVKRLKYERVLL